MTHGIDAVRKSIVAVAYHPLTPLILHGDFGGDISLGMLLGEPIEYGEIHLRRQQLIDVRGWLSDHAIGIDVKDGAPVAIHQELHEVGLGEP